MFGLVPIRASQLHPLPQKRRSIVSLISGWGFALWFALGVSSIASHGLMAQGPNNALGAGTPQAPAIVPAKVSPPAKPSASDDTFLEVVFSGGIMGIGIMVVLILLSIVAVYLVIDQAFALRKKELVPPDLVEEVRLLLSQGKLKEADQKCRERPCPLSFVLVSGMSEIEFGWPAVEKALEDSTAEQAARLYRKLEYLSVIGNIAPMLGLLGTVTGMILAFRQVALSQGTAGAGDLAGGIYSALVTTVAGLVIAIPSLAAFAVFRNKIDEVISDTAYSAQHVFGSVRRRIPGATATRPVAAPPRGTS
jgi:biopolymer transport protein ExbB